ncbi:MAG: methylated-DNA--[protein]-cysteine S-methyltransferase [Sphaerochaeta associata]|uniref:methylated-DNA--[protein]-cysteine S-methyltransferase n=1 Tax=Sphaerochaeta associata TaxID=1129264 RepID=UPI002B1F9353|nr:methylated-DNA--[protein]-cysteine S-methyltransferase [Sphaerochaeta associata]MEA5106640.1 methylated-DNA--[protein]-cysteine S-methyltransferase [Sphaerochaeta associata]
MQYGKIYDSPIGLLHLQCNDTHITALSFYHAGPILQLNHPLLDKACTQLDEYFEGKRKVFTLPLLIEGTPFQKQVYAALLSIEYGQTASYEEIAMRIGNPKACRAVGMANNRNRLALLIPCHRVVGKHGSLVGYEGGLEKKSWLLDFERRHRSS